MLTLFSYTELKPIKSIVLFELIVYLFWPVHKMEESNFYYHTNQDHTSPWQKDKVGLSGIL